MICPPISSVFRSQAATSDRSRSHIHPARMPRNLPLGRRSTPRHGPTPPTHRDRHERSRYREKRFSDMNHLPRVGKNACDVTITIFRRSCGSRLPNSSSPFAKGGPQQRPSAGLCHDRHSNVDEVAATNSHVRGIDSRNQSPILRDMNRKASNMRLKLYHQ